MGKTEKDWKTVVIFPLTESLTGKLMIRQSNDLRYQNQWIEVKRNKHAFK